MENTLENKAKFFAQYWGQEIQWDNTLDFSTHQRFDNIDLRVREGDCLVLKPLSSITDEDLKAIAKFYEPTAHEVKFSDDQICFDFIYGDSHASGAIEYNSDFAQDYLRSKGYALPWMGLSVEKLEQYGWIKLKKPEDERQST